MLYPNSFRQIIQDGYSYRNRPNNLPFYWIRFSYNFQNAQAFYDCQLLFLARNIPFQISHKAGIFYLYIPALLFDFALCEYQAFIEENRPKKIKQKVAEKIYPYSAWSNSLLLIIVLCYFLQDAYHLLDLAALDSARVLIYKEWYRCLTALFLHTNAVHILSNLVTATLLLPLISKRISLGTTLSFTILGGSLANFIAIYLKKPPFISLGFSTAVFVLIGLLCATVPNLSKNWFRNCLTWQKQEFLALATSLAFLAMLGFGDAKTDFVAHISGLGVGLGLGYLTKFLQNLQLELPNLILGLVTLTGMISAWFLVIQQII